MKEGKSLKDFFRSMIKQWNKRHLLLLLWYLLLAVGVNLIVEFCNRRSVPALVEYIVNKPMQFAFGILIVYLTLLFCMLFRKRNYLLMLVAGVWVVLSVISYIMLSGFRATPLTAPDIAILRSVRDIIQIYMNNVTVTLLLILIALAAGFIVFLAFRFKSHHAPYAFALVNIGIVALLITCAGGYLRGTGYLNTQFTNIPDAYQDNGFVYCFTCSAIYQGIDRPEDYSEDTINAIMDEINTVQAPESVKTPNIVFVQLESFFDVKHLANIEYSEDPLPNFTALKENCSSGLFSVPSIGAGTVNTEFEVLSQMNLQDFGMGEYPYKTVVRYRVCDSIAYALKELGYTNHAIHNNNATFYSRNRVYTNFGFDTFTSVEYMNDVELNPLGWAKDKCLSGEILSTLRSTKDKDFVFAVSVQPHGQYPSEVIDDTQTIRVTSGMEDDARLTGFEYYINQLHDTDAFVGELIQMLQQYPEDVVVVFYGDHLPSFNITDEELNTGNVQTTEYAIWANFDLPVEKRDIYAYQLSSTVMEKLGITNGILTKYHMLHYDAPAQDPEYLRGLLALDYDMLYGQQYCYGGQMPIAATNMRLGIVDATITNTSYRQAEDAMFVFGENFTPYSVVLVEDEQYPTQFVSPRILRVEGVTVHAGDRVTVGQASKTDALRILSTTEPYIYPG